jgi:hypothetical protein
MMHLSHPTPSVACPRPAGFRGRNATVPASLNPLFS